MSGYRFTKIGVAVSLAAMLAACAHKSVTPLQLVTQKIEKPKLDIAQSEADTYAIIAMDAYDREDFATAARYFEKLYDLDPRKEFLIEAIKSASMRKDFKTIKRLLEKGKGKFGDDKFINRYLVAYYLDRHQIDKAESIVQKLLARQPEEKDYELAAILAKVRGDMPEAERYYTKAYEIAHAPKTLLALSELYLQQNRTDRAIRMLETHIRIYGCDRAVCGMLVKIYTQKQDLKALESIYKRLYRKTKDPLYANALLELYAYQKRYDDAIAFLKREHFDDDTLLDIYTAKRDYRHALRLANRLYRERLDPKYLAKAAILEYEGAPVKSKKVLHDVLQKFEQSVYKLDDPLFYNYYAYLLIDHDIDVAKGIRLVKKALAQVPDSLFYIDTLAWGYYKEGKCREAWKLMQPYLDEKEPEIVEHIEKIKKCLKENAQ